MNNRIELLRSLETDVYRAAYYLLQNEEAACEAAKQVLLALYRRADLAELSGSYRRSMLTNLVLRVSAAQG